MNLEFHTGDPEAELDTKSPDAFRTISEVAEDLDIPQHVLRFWETRFSQIKPLKRGGGRRYYRPDDVVLLKGIRRLLYGEGYTIKGLQRILKEQGPRHVQAIGRGAPVGAAPPEDAARPRPEAPAQQPGIGAPQISEPGFPGNASVAAGRHDDVALLGAVLSELAECQRVLRGVLQPQPAADSL